MRLFVFYIAVLSGLTIHVAAGAQGAFVSSVEQGIATFYADYLHGQTTAYGEIYRRELFTCSHLTYPVGTILKVTRLDNGRQVTVRVNDRGDFTDGVVIDLSAAAARALDMLKSGKVWVMVEQIGFSEKNPLETKELSYAQTVPQAYGQADFFTPRGTMSEAGAPNVYSGPFPSPGNGNIGIQLGSYGVYANAVRARQHLESLGLSHIWIQQTNTAEGMPLFRVVLSSFASRKDAEAYLTRFLREIHLLDGILISLP